MTDLPPAHPTVWYDTWPDFTNRVVGKWEYFHKGGNVIYVFL